MTCGVAEVREGENGPEVRLVLWVTEVWRRAPFRLRGGDPMGP